ncbi:MAG: hypothetical protein LBN08_01465 [Lactobacillales bacterium]|jgi:uncharacterized membrane protein|nr:hypothetical protein [Lactobacillales bacterium]
MNNKIEQRVKWNVVIGSIFTVIGLVGLFKLETITQASLSGAIFAAALVVTISQIRIFKNPELMKKYAVIKLDERNVFITQRSYVAATLVMAAVLGLISIFAASTQVALSDAGVMVLYGWCAVYAIAQKIFKKIY